MVISKFMGIDGLGSIKCTVRAWQAKVVAAFATTSDSRGASGLDAAIEYDVGLSDRRPLPSRPRGELPYQASVEAMLNRRY